MTHLACMHTRHQSGRYWNTGATAEQGHTLNTQTQEVTMSNRHTEAERLRLAVLQLARLNLQDQLRITPDGPTVNEKYILLADEAANILSALADRVEAEAFSISGGAR